MRSLFGVAVFFFSTLSFACPNLVGKYDCGEDFTVNVEMALVSGVITYTINSAVIPADGTTVKSIGDTGEKYTTAQCKGKYLEVSEKSYVTAPIPGVELEALMTYHLDKFGGLKYNMKSKFTLFGETQDIPDMPFSCKFIP